MGGAEKERQYWTIGAVFICGVKHKQLFLSIVLSMKRVFLGEEEKKRKEYCKRR